MFYRRVEFISQLSKEGAKEIDSGTFICPLEGESYPRTALRKEDFPLPTGPTIATKLPGFTSRLIEERT